MQAGSVYSNLPNRPLKVCPVSLLPAPLVAWLQSYNRPTQRENLRPFYRPPPLPDRNRLPNQASSPFLCLSVLSGHTPLVGCFVRFCYFFETCVDVPLASPFHSIAVPILYQRQGMPEETGDAAIKRCVSGCGVALWQNPPIRTIRHAKNCKGGQREVREELESGESPMVPALQLLR
jgi:hypothetical protein